MVDHLKKTLSHCGCTGQLSGVRRKYGEICSCKRFNDLCSAKTGPRQKEKYYFTTMTHVLYISTLITQLLTREINILTQNIDSEMILLIYCVCNIHLVYDQLHPKELSISLITAFCYMEITDHRAP